MLALSHWSRIRLSDTHFFYLENFFVSGLLQTVILLFPFIAVELHLNLSQVGFLEGARNVVGIALAIPSAYIFSSLGGVRMSVLCIVGMVALMFAMSFSSVYWIFALGYFFLGMVQKGLSLNAALVGKYAHDQSRRGAIMGMFYGMGDMGKVALSTAILFLVPYIGWRYGFRLACLLGVVFLVLALVVGIRKQSKQPEGDTKNNSHTPWKLIFKTRSYMLALWMTLFDTLSSTPVLLFLGFLLLSKNFSAASLGIYTGAFFIGLLFGRAGFGRSADRIHPVKVFMIMQLCMAVLLIMLVQFSHPILVAVTCALLGAFTRGTIPVRQLIILESIEIFDGRPDRAVGLNTMLYNIVTAVAAYGFGWLADLYGIECVYYISAFIAVLAVIPAFVSYLSDPNYSARLRDVV